MATELVPQRRKTKEEAQREAKSEAYGHQRCPGTAGGKPERRRSAGRERKPEQQRSAGRVAYPAACRKAAQTALVPYRDAEFDLRPVLCGLRDSCSIPMALDEHNGDMASGSAMIDVTKAAASGSASAQAAFRQTLSRATVNDRRRAYSRVEGMEESHLTARHRLAEIRAAARSEYLYIREDATVEAGREAAWRIMDQYLYYVYATRSAKRARGKRAREGTLVRPIKTSTAARYAVTVVELHESMRNVGLAFRRPMMAQ